MLDIKIQSKNKDNFEAFKNTQIPLADGTFVALNQVASFNVIKGFEQLLKDNALKNFYIYSQVDTDIITAGEVIEKIQPVLDEVQNSGIKLVFKGEEEKKKDLKS